MFDKYILGDSDLHWRLNLAIHILSKILTRRSRQITLEALALEGGLERKSLRAMCETLRGAGLLKIEGRGENAELILIADPYCTTIEDLVFGLAKSKRRCDCSPNKLAGESCAFASNPFLMQATLNVNRLALSYLRQFTLDKLTTMGKGRDIDALQCLLSRVSRE